MKLSKLLITVFAVTFSVGALTAADKPAKAKGAKASPSAAYKVDLSQSKISWLGKKVTGQHNGIIGIKSGAVEVTNGSVSGGKIVIDANNIVVEDLQGEWKDKLEGHLKSEDFFGVEKNPEIVFQIKTVDKLAEPSTNGTHKVTGTLTIKGKTNPIEFPANVRVNDQWVTAEAKGISVDRTLYGIRYGSGKFFENLGDKTINDNFWLDIAFAAQK